MVGTASGRAAGLRQVQEGSGYLQVLRAPEEVEREGGREGGREGEREGEREGRRKGGKEKRHF